MAAVITMTDITEITGAAGGTQAGRRQEKTKCWRWSCMSCAIR